MRALLSAVVALGAAAGDDDRLANGETVMEFRSVEGSSQPALFTSAVIEAPPERVFAVVDDCGGYAGLMPRVVSSAELSRDAGSSVCTWVVDMPFPMKDVSTEVAVTSARSPGRWTREFKQTKGGFLRNEGLWTLTPFRGHPARTRLDYRLLVTADVAFPDAFVRNGQRDGVNDLLKNLRRKVAAADSGR